MKRKIATESDQPQVSSILMDELGKVPIIIGGNWTTLLLFRRYLEVIILIGETEHTGDWYLYLEVNLTDGTTFCTECGYPEIILKDVFGNTYGKADGDEDELMKSHSIFTEEFLLNCSDSTVGFYKELTEEDFDKGIYEPRVRYVNFNQIKSIQLYR